MRALRYGSFGDAGVLALQDVPRPAIGADEVLIRVAAASLNPFDTKLRSGQLGDLFEVDFPITPGRDGCGEVVFLGDSAGEDLGAVLKPGQRVCFVSSDIQHGSLAEFVAVKAKGFVVAAPRTVTDVACAALPLVGLSAWNALVDTAELQRGMKALIHGGSGGVGSVAIQIARHLGAEVYSTCSSANVERVEGLGAIAIPYDSVDFTKVVPGCDVIFDIVGGRVREESYKVLNKDGRLVYLIAEPVKDISGNADVRTRQVMVTDRVANLRHVMELAADGIIVAQVAKVLPLAEFGAAFQLLESGSASGKVVVELHGDKHEA